MVFNSSEYWLTTHLNGWNILRVITDQVLRYRVGDIVEIGMGASSTILAEIAQKYGVKLVSCDIQMGGMWKAYTDRLFKQHICFIGESTQFIKKYKGVPAVVFLDGEHNYKTVKKEMDFFLEVLMPQGVLFLHDTFPKKESQLGDNPKPHDVYKARQELERNPDYDIFTWPYSAVDMGLTMVMKHDENRDRPYWRKNGRVVAER